ncbi:formylmethanofuran dehydrogenase subunit E [Desulfonauticus submarinus]|uniref:Formylmethanofuran dehydrogenase subunit E n=1 Tax=Desulfonauticus submarinus TaxID=206665 RepID=A0A1H0E1E3_9BACT|nr:FmdE family protein [Desulfonauticus submarinus]SDN76106.1 formylmethanofuran dehydrogenase subunit E [Desulfonauticus submarinus]
MKIGEYSFSEFKNLVREFHGSPAPGIFLGAVMVKKAKSLLSPDILFDAICESAKCLPDAVQLLTPCTIGNGWLKIFHLGRYALTLYDKYSGEGVRVFVDTEKLDSAPIIKEWFFKLKPKQEQNLEEILNEIMEKGEEILSWQKVKVHLDLVAKKKRSGFAVCPLCKEAYPAADGSICRACQGESPYQELAEAEVSLQTVKIEEAIGKPLVHDLTQIIPGKSKGAVFKKGDVVSVGDLCRLQQMGKKHVYLPLTDEKDFIHEDKVAEEFAKYMAGDGVDVVLPPSEGKVNLVAGRDGLFVVNKEALIAFNQVPYVMCASRQSFSVVRKGGLLAGTRAIPLYLAKKYFLQALSFLQTPIFKVIPLVKKRVGLLITGNEVFYGHIKDKFEPIIQNKVKALGSEVVISLKSPDDTNKIKGAITKILSAGVDIIITTAGLSVDPDDVTRKGLIEAGLENFVYGAPILPGAMTLVGKIGQVKVLGVPACALFFKRTSLDLILPRLLAGLDVSRKDFSYMAEGGLCLNCKECTFPKCYFGK